VSAPAPESSSHPSGAHAHRVIFVDLARALAVFFMMYGHTVAALLAPQYQQGTWYDVWQFQRGLTSSLFLLLGGFAFSLATRRHWVPQADSTWAVVKRLRRFVLFVLLGYSLHLPVYRLIDLPLATPENWQAFQNVDVLQLVGTTLIALQLLALVSRSRRVFMTVSFALAATVVLVTAPAARVDWTMRVSSWVAPYLSTATGSLFPLLPWSAFALTGAGLGQIYSRWGAAHLSAFARWGLLVPGAILLGLAFVSRVAPYPQFTGNPFDWPPTEFAVRTGPCLIIMGIIAIASRRIQHLPRMFGAIAQESLLVYFVHLCIVYGSAWNNGLYKWYAASLGPMATLAAVLFVVVSMTALAYAWNYTKRTRPRTAKQIAWYGGAALIIWLLVRPA
jgi:uncharacterized membrane protein